MNRIEQTLGTIINEARKNKRITLRELEARTGISNAYLSQLENDKIKEPSAVKLVRISQALGISFDHMFVTSGVSAKVEFDPQNLRVFPEIITDDEEKELLKYLEFLRFKSIKL